MSIRDQFRRQRHGSDRTKGKWCFYCGCRLHMPRNGEDHPDNCATLDHLTPRQRGGELVPNNTVEACKRCNGEKGNMTLDEYRLITAYRHGVVEKWHDYKFWAERPR